MSNTSLTPGTGGRVVAVKANTFEISRLPTRTFYQYHLEISPEALRPDRRLAIFMRLQDQNAARFNPRAVFDGKFNVYAISHDLDGSYHVRMGLAPPNNPNPRPPKLFEVTLMKVKAINPLRINESFVNKREQVSDVIAMLQIFLRQAVATRCVYPPTSKTLYTSDGYKSLGSGLEIWRGIFQSVRAGFDRLFVNVDASFGIMYGQGPLISVAMDLLKFRDKRDLATLEPNSPKWNQLKVFLKGVQVTVSTLPKRSPKRIEAIIPRAGRYTFMCDDREITVADYFQLTHSQRVENPDIFGIQIGSKTRKDVFPAQFCNIVGGQLYRNRISPEVTQSMIKLSETKPQDRLSMISRAVSGRGATILDYANSDFMLNVGLTVNPNPMDIRGRYINAPGIKFEDGQVVPNNGAWNVVNHRFFKSGFILCWTIINFERNIRPEVLERFADTLVLCLAKLGVQQIFGNKLGPPKRPAFHSGIGQNPTYALEQVFNRMDVNGAFISYDRAVEENNSRLASRPSPLVIVILPTYAADIRKEVKQWGDMITAVPTQCVRQDKLVKANDQYCNNLALKINTRLNGINSVAKDGWMDRLSRVPTMVAAADVSHPGPGIMHKPSMTGLVASTDENFTRYSAFSHIQHPRLEIIDKLDEMIRDALLRFGDVNFNQTSRGIVPVLPQRIIFYRDGVSEGEYQQILDIEVPKIKAGIDATWAKFPSQNAKIPQKPTLTVIVVGKRHHIRFFPADPRQSDGKTGNCFGGLVVDRDVNAHGTFFDFYLQSQGGLKGTSRPSHYVVVYNEDKELTADSLQGVSYALCHTHARATRSVGIPAPVYYADLVCARVDYHLMGRDYEESVRSGGSGPPPAFDLEEWEKKFNKPKCPSNMYFL